MVEELEHCPFMEIRQRPGGNAQSSRLAQQAISKSGRASEYAELMKEAGKSKKDIFTGRYHCLSCGKGFEDLRPLADHLRKHDGINSQDFKVMQYRQQHREGRSAPRACKTGFLLADLLDAAALKSKGKKGKGETIVRVSTMADRRESSVKPKKKIDDTKVDKIDQEERKILETAFRGLRLKSEFSLAVRTVDHWTTETFSVESTVQ